MEFLKRRGFLIRAAALTAIPQLVRGGVASQHFAEWYQCKLDIRYFLKTWFKLPGTGGSPRSYEPHHWLNILNDDQDNNHYLLKVGAQSSPETVAAIATHRLVFGSDISIMLGGLDRDLAGSRVALHAIQFALRQLPQWMLANPLPNRVDVIQLTGGNRLFTRFTPQPCSDLLIADADRVHARDLERAVRAVGYARVVMTTSKNSYQPPVPCITLADGALENFMSALDTAN